jgi:hypothetical protein
MNDFEWEVFEDGVVVARFNAQLRADLYARAESKQCPGHHYLIRHIKNPEGNGSAIIHQGRTFVRQG